MTKRVLIVVTTADKLSDTERTGLWLSEFGEAFIAFSKQGYDITIASPLGGQAPLDHRSLEGISQELRETAHYLTDTIKLSLGWSTGKPLRPLPMKKRGRRPWTGICRFCWNPSFAS